jgi:hypothetical protein
VPFQVHAANFEIWSFTLSHIDIDFLTRLGTDLSTLEFSARLDRAGVFLFFLFVVTVGRPLSIYTPRTQFPIRIRGAIPFTPTQPMRNNTPQIRMKRRRTLVSQNLLLGIPYPLPRTLARTIHNRVIVIPKHQLARVVVHPVFPLALPEPDDRETARRLELDVERARDDEVARVRVGRG